MRTKSEENIRYEGKKGARKTPEKLISQTKCNYGCVYYEKELLEQFRRLNNVFRRDERNAKSVSKFFGIGKDEHIISAFSIKLLQYGKESIVVTGTVINNVFHVGDAWVWDHISNLWGF